MNQHQMKSPTNLVYAARIDAQSHQSHVFLLLYSLLWSQMKTIAQFLSSNSYEACVETTIIPRIYWSRTLTRVEVWGSDSTFSPSKFLLSGHFCRNWFIAKVFWVWGPRHQGCIPAITLDNGLGEHIHAVGQWLPSRILSLKFSLLERKYIAIK